MPSKNKKIAVDGYDILRHLTRMEKTEIVKVLKVSIRMLNEDLDENNIAEFMENFGMEPLDSVIKRVGSNDLTYHQALFLVDDYVVKYRKALARMKLNK